ncbi:MAG TPA: helix-turn-helix domain-containing protein [Candidatus Acidoferrum sp.]|jgi:excisionase family DNA binding protein
MRDALEPVLALAKNLPREELPRLIGDLAEISATAGARLSIHAVEAVRDELVDIEETAERIGGISSRLARSPLAYSVREAAALLGMSSRTVKRLILAKQLHSTKQRGRRLIARTELETFVRESHTKTGK